MRFWRFVGFFFFTFGLSALISLTRDLVSGPASSSLSSVVLSMCFMLTCLYLAILGWLYFWSTFTMERDWDRYQKMLADFGLKNSYKVVVYDGFHGKATSTNVVLFYRYMGVDYVCTPSSKTGYICRKLSRKPRFQVAVNFPFEHVLIFDTYLDKWTLFEP